jgi:hypothetical protein
MLVAWRVLPFDGSTGKGAVMLATTSNLLPFGLTVQLTRMPFSPSTPRLPLELTVVCGTFCTASPGKGALVQ